VGIDTIISTYVLKSDYFGMHVHVF